ncbi:hypothetical protein A0H81_07769 [Grifola frondosa]|uniref:Uncharacterized protein n=1 Tax=Grifola frondosa TaxID=5627 RepID=A0A1C7M5L9_GRIFR|nr:hypothetical protein A0H81_07769 [Grifola frondosa]
MPKNSFRPHWAFIIRVAKDKHALWESLSGSDRYWLMRASLEQSKENLASSRSRAEQSLHFARLQYNKICKNSSHPDLHIPYIQTLLSWPTPEYLTEVVGSLCKLLRMHEHCGARVLEILWQLAFKSRDELPAALKQEVLHTIWDRVDPGRDTEDTNDAVGGTRSLTPLLSGPTSFTQQRTFYVHDLAAALNGTIFDRRRMRSSSQSPAQRQLLDWAASVALELCPYSGSCEEFV